MVLKKAAMGVQMDREAILQQTPEPAPEPRPANADGTDPVVDLRQEPDAEVAAPRVRTAPLPSTTAATQPPRPAPKRTSKPKPAPAAAAPVGGWSYTVLLTEEQWAWVESEASRRGIAKRYVLLSAVEAHRKALAEYFRTTVQESASLFHWTGEPKDVEGRKVSKSLRFPPAEREILQGLIEEAGAPSMAMYLRIAADIEMKAQGKA